MSDYKGRYDERLNMVILGEGEMKLEGSYDSYKISPRTDMTFTGFRVAHPNKPNGTPQEKYDHFRIDFDYYNVEFVVLQGTKMHSLIVEIITGPSNDATVKYLTMEVLEMLRQNIEPALFIRLMVEEMITINNRANSVGQDMKAKDVRERLGL